MYIAQNINGKIVINHDAFEFLCFCFVPLCDLLFYILRMYKFFDNYVMNGWSALSAVTKVDLDHGCNIFNLYSLTIQLFEWFLFTRYIIL